ncbi:MAG: esterase [Candidatus Rokubacteria bacterium]|nr:esterase [Candidatus Rokubacteria bacterium]
MTADRRAMWVTGVAVALAALGIAALVPASSTRALQVDGRERTFVIHVPPGVGADRPLPVVLVFHGGGATGAATERSIGFDRLADRDGFIAVYPDGLNRSWNDGRDDPVIPSYRDGIDDVAFVDALLAAVGRDRAIDARRIYATGISNGAIFSQYLAVRRASRIAAIAPVAGGLGEPVRFTPDAAVSVLIMQGTDDPLVPYHGGAITLMNRPRGRILDTDAVVALWVRHNGCALSPVVEDVAHRDPDDGCRARRYVYPGGRDGSEVVLYRFEGGGHTWPGGRQYLPERVIGRVCRDVDATEVIWDFFRGHPKLGGSGRPPDD